MWTTRQFRSKGKQREEPSYGTYAARRGNPLVGQVSVCQVLARQRGYTPRFYFELYCTAYLRDPCGPRRIDERRERRFIGNAAGLWARRFPGKTHKSQRGAVHASPGDVRDPTQRAGFNSGCDAVALHKRRELLPIGITRLQAALSRALCIVAVR